LIDVYELVYEEYGEDGIVEVLEFAFGLAGGFIY